MAEIPEEQELEPRQRRFVEEYIRDLNGTQAAIRAGYSAHTANEQAARLLAKANIQRAVEQEKRKRSERTHVDQDRVVKEFARIAFAQLRSVCEWDTDSITFHMPDDISDDDHAAIAEISIQPGKEGVARRIKMHNKIDALKSLFLHVGGPGGKDPLDELVNLIIGGDGEVARKLAGLLREHSKRKRAGGADGGSRGKPES